MGAEKPGRVDDARGRLRNRDLRAEVRAGAFREDLFFRLNVFTVRIPPLAERRDDIQPGGILPGARQAKVNRRLAGMSAEALHC